MHISTDIGGTFTDFVVSDGEKLKTFKVLSTPQKPELAIERGLDRLTPATSFSHGATIATNAVLERKGATIGLITTKGFADLLKIGRQKRVQLYTFDSARPKPLVDLYFEISERVSSKGVIITPAPEEEVLAVVEQLKALGIDSVAICFLFSFLNPENERVVRDSLEKAGIHVSCSSDVLPEFREYERMSTTVLDAYLKRIVGGYITRIEAILAKKQEQFYVMQSNGGVVKSGLVKKKPVNMLLSGPAGGVAASKFLCELIGLDNLITYDMGGTSADVSTVVNGNLSWTSESSINGLPLKLPVVDIVTVGAGGGSIAWLDAGGALRVGPESAGATPGPICYGLGGTDVTVTDCDLLCGFINPNYFLGGELVLEVENARIRVEKLAHELGMSYEDTILGVGKVVNSNMIKAIRLVSVERGLDTREFSLIAFGGAGPVHAAALAQELNIPKVIVPFAPGVFSAYGILVSDVQLDYSKTDILCVTGAEDFVTATLEEFTAGARRELAEQNIDFEDAILLPSLDMRYVGQSYELNVRFNGLENARKLFYEQYNQLYGYSMPSEDVEIVNVRLRVIAPRAKQKPSKVDVKRNGKPVEYRKVLFEAGIEKTPVYRGADLPVEHVGAAIIEGKGSTVVVPPGMSFSVDAYGNIVIFTS
ncbi:MAG: hydantoinase/oxoprolinase family protein [Euryarchaeota archaeon]|nr:hydantoinase/oxoprolinase family protein [Euryarchaeota archaeon]